MAWNDELIKGEYAEWYAEQDGLLRFLRDLLSAGVVTPDQTLAIDASARREMGEAAQFALSSPYPQPHEALDHVFA
jgi:TPP-dependent pyruvate/acetoin dehydrogenase alpha subunit